MTEETKASGRFELANTLTAATVLLTFGDSGFAVQRTVLFRGTPTEMGRAVESAAQLLGATAIIREVRSL